MLKSLVCRCYMFYSCEYLLKFSSELSEIPPSSLVYKEENSDSIIIQEKSGKTLVKCRYVNVVSTYVDYNCV